MACKYCHPKVSQKYAQLRNAIRVLFLAHKNQSHNLGVMALNEIQKITGLKLGNKETK